MIFDLHAKLAKPLPYLGLARVHVRVQERVVVVYMGVTLHCVVLLCDIEVSMYIAGLSNVRYIHVPSVKM